MDDLQEILKQALTFLGKKLDAIVNKQIIPQGMIDNIKMMAEKEMPEMKIPDTQKISIDGIEVITLKGEKGDRGNVGKDSDVPGPKGDKGNSGKGGKSIIGPKGNRGDPGKDSKIPGPKGDKGNPGKDGSPDIGEEIIGKINKDKSGKVIKKEHVEGLSDIESMAKTAEANSRFGMRAAGDTVYLADLSSQTNGVLKTFTIPVFRRAIMVTCSDFPTVLFLNNGFTVAGGTLTLTTDSAPSSGSMLGFLYII